MFLSTLGDGVAAARPHDDAIAATTSSSYQCYSDACMPGTTLEVPQQRPVAVDRPAPPRADVPTYILREVAVGVEDAQAAPLRVHSQILPVDLRQLLPEI